MDRIEIDLYVPFLPCPCMGGREDRKTSRLNEDLLLLRNEGLPIVIRCFALNQHLARFRERPELAEILQTKGNSGLPVLYVNGKIAFQGEYPDKDRLRAALTAG